MSKIFHKLSIALVVVIAGLLLALPTAWADAPMLQGEGQIHLEVSPGERAEATIQLASSQDLAEEGQLAEITLEINAVSGWCRGIIQGRGVVGQLLWQWDVYQLYEHDGRRVFATGHFDWPTVHYTGWAFTHAGYSLVGDGTDRLVAGSSGHFTYHRNWQRKAGNLHFGIQANGNCSVWGEIVDW